MEAEIRNRIIRMARIGQGIRDNQFSTMNLQLMCEIFGCTEYNNLNREQLKRFTFDCLRDITSQEDRSQLQ